MLGQHGRGLTTSLFTRPALALARAGVSANMITVTGTVLTVVISALTLAQGRFVLGPVLLALVVVADSFDGILARATGTGSAFGAFLDSTMDRLGDGALLGSLAVWAALHMEAGALRTTTVSVAVTAVVLAAAVPYARARAEAIGADASAGLLERTDRIVLTAVGVLAVGLGAPQWVLTVALALVALGSLATVVQRVLAVRRQTLPAAQPGEQA
ncbi:CDP-alcohol phosphatidyltransferase family protein [Actinomyces howellii]|uniref:Phosphatidylinositol phosphate synthase n=1 Tax=Actinomyces howellii TaxID=52771 RepID=A0A3S5EGV9_9ACTO|nr:CDP-alcohol phosphatidyltransferase family protein [Actinomyces howellii]VEG25916.1 CDP-diacylglycerol--inositol 3-phosphatidyltransferase [Actinomyces howellii]